MVNDIHTNTNDDVDSYFVLNDFDKNSPFGDLELLSDYRVCYRSDRTPQQSRRNAKHLPGIRLYRHYGGSPQSAVYRQTERQSYNEGAYP